MVKIPCSIIGLIAFVGIQAVIIILGRILPHEAIGLANLAMMLTILGGILGIFVSLKFMNHYQLRDKDNTHELDRKTWITIIILCFLLWLFGGQAGEYLAETFNDQKTVQYNELFGNSSIGLVLVAALFVGPFSEEFIFRGMFFTSMRRDLGAREAALINAFLFVLVHQTLMHVFFTFGLALLLSYTMQKTNNLYDCIMIHIGFNFSSTILGAFTELAFFDVIKNPFVCITGSVLIIAYIYIKFIKDLPGKTRRLSD